MKIAKLLLAPLALLVASAAPAQQAVEPADSAAAARVRADVEFLASDLLEGRDTGSRGYDIAAAYVASQFRGIGLTPGGANGGWYQQVPLRRASANGKATAALQIGRRTMQLKPMSDFAVRPSLSIKDRKIDAPLVFAGQGISDPTLGIDNYRGIDARGKIVVVLEDAPNGLPSEIAAHLQSWKRDIAAAKGAIGLLEIAGTGKRPGSERLEPFARPSVDWVDSSGKSASSSAKLALVGGISESLARKLLDSDGKDLGRMLADSRKGRTVAAFDLPARLRLSDTTEWQDFSSPNVIGILPGSDPSLKAEHVVLMAHLDHLGTKPGARPGEDSIYNGALDNAAGIATMIEAARKFVQSGKKPRRSVLFIAVTGEEKGLRGADFYATSPTVPRDGIVGVVNLDMPMLLYPFTDVVAFGGEHSTIASTIAEAARDMGVSVSPDPMPEEAIFVRSDHYAFVKQGIPAILLMTGYGNGGDRKWKEFFARYYHKPSDDLSQPILWDQAARYAELNYRISRALADASKRPSWYGGDYFGDAFAPGQKRAQKHSAQPATATAP